ncbi:metal-dependent hydrolase [Sporosarcina soli]|uniref:Metal-dependent hydrolase n=1 Tax=Sporosarcina soli TaxID=334736 RepID=A0ABW0TFW5_9BACL
MRGKTHIVGGIAASLALAQLYQYDPGIAMGAGVVGALVPDICHSGSKIGRKFPLLSKLVNKVFGHRTFTHSLLFFAIIAFVLDIYLSNDAIRAGFLAGLASHLLLDMATKNGIQLLYPIKFTVRLPLTAKTGGKVESIVFAALSLLSFYLGYIAFAYYL